MLPAAVVGRDRELETIERVLADVSHARALVLEGEAGIGKTTLFEAAVQRAGADRDVLYARAAQAETQLSFAAAADLLAGRLDSVAPALAPAQLTALEIAFRLRAAGPSRLDPHLVAAAFLAAFRALAAHAALVVAIDDAQWLDAASEGLLAYTARRLSTEPVLLLIARRAAEDDPLPLGLEPDVTERIVVRAMSLGALHELLRVRLGTTYPRPTIRRLHAGAGGNPFYALEIARALERRGVVVAGDQPLPVPPTLVDVVAERIDALDPTARDVCAFVAALSHADLETVERVLASERLAGGLDAAVESGILSLSSGRVAFTHPLLAATVYGRLGPERRRAVHTRLAATVSDEEERALHLALAESAPDEAVAGELEEAASRAQRRGALDVAASLLEHAARLTPAGPARSRRVVGAARVLVEGGDPRRARTLIDEVSASLPRGPLRAEALTITAVIEDDLAACVDLCEQAIAEAHGEPRVEAEARYVLAVVHTIRCEFADAVVQAGRAAELAHRSGDSETESLALGELGHARTFLGHGVTPESLRAVEIERSAGFTGQLSGGALLGRVLMFDAQLGRAREQLNEELDRAASAGHDGARAILLQDLALVELRNGGWAAAEQLARQASALAHQVSTEQMSASSLYYPAVVEALTGHAEPARAKALAGLATAERIGDVMFALKHRGVLGLVEVSRGDNAAAQAWLGPAVERMAAAGVREVTTFDVVENALDALVGLGLVDEADALVRHLEDPSLPAGGVWTRAAAARGRGLVHSARGEIEAAKASMERSIELYACNPFERARTLLALGVVERRAKRKRAARALLEEALATFERLPAPLWADRARAELRRLTTRRASTTLTETEARIAELAARGLTNREIAAAAFVSQKTVEANLSKIYRKLGVRGRVELARRMGATTDDPAARESTVPPANRR